MLVELSIANLAIIEELRLQFGAGLSVLTGETGTGKSIIIDAVQLLLGGRASTEMIRTGAQVAAVEGVFAPDEEARAALRGLWQELGLSDDEEEIILRREISHGRRNACRLNGRAVPLNVLEDVGRHLIDIHGQGEHLSLLQVRRHVDFLDRFGGLMPQRQSFATVVHELQQVRHELQALRQDARELARRVDLLTYQVEEIEAAALQPDEEEELRRERNLLANAEKLMRLSESAYALLADGEESQRSVTDLLSSVQDDLTTLARLDETQQAQAQLVESSLEQLDDLARNLRRYRDAVEYNPERLQSVEERVDLIRSLKLKYGDSIAEVIAFGERARQELEQITHSEERTEELLAREQALLDELAMLGQALMLARQEAAQRLRQHVERELADLSMERAEFLVRLDRGEDPQGPEIDGRRFAFDATGLDRVEFFIAPNPGEEAKPLAKIASGGETSRLMLAMKTALSSIDPVPTLIFDEIDTGIGGRTGAVVGKKLWTLARRHQVFCVTHLAQIACYGDQHFRVVKDIVGERTLSFAQALPTEERVEELAIMLGGAATEATRRSAAELIQRVAQLSTTA